MDDQSQTNQNPPQKQPDTDSTQSSFPQAEAYSGLDPAWTVSVPQQGQYHTPQTQKQQQAVQAHHQPSPNQQNRSRIMPTGVITPGGKVVTNPVEPAPHPQQNQAAEQQQESDLIGLSRPSQSSQLSTSHGGPEREPIPIQTPETAPLMEVGFEQEMDPEVQEYMQRVERDKVALNQPIVVHGQTIVQPAHWPGKEPTFQMPASREVIVAGLRAKVHKSVRWLATWCVKMFKKFQGRVIYTDVPGVDEE